MAGIHYFEIVARPLLKDIPATTRTSGTTAVHTPVTTKSATRRRKAVHARSASVVTPNLGSDSSNTYTFTDDGTTFTDVYESHTLCDLSALHCPDGQTCYTGGTYVGCCSSGHACSARSTCLSWVKDQAVCDDEKDGCVFCSDPAMSNCFTYENSEASVGEDGNTFGQTAYWCTNAKQSLLFTTGYTNIIGFGSQAAYPDSTFSPHLTTTHTSTTPPSSSLLSSSSSTTSTTSAAAFANDSMSSGGLAGIIIGSVLGSAALVAFLAFILRHWKDTQARKKQQEQYHGTLGGAVLPGMWRNNSQSNIQGPAGENTEDDRETKNLGASRAEDRASISTELANTAIAPYTRELDSTHLPQSRASIATRSGFAPYSPMDIRIPMAPYANARASQSESQLHDNTYTPAEIYRGKDGQPLIGSNAGDQMRTSYHGLNQNQSLTPRTNIVSQYSPAFSSDSSNPSPMVSPLVGSVSPSTSSHRVSPNPQHQSFGMVDTPRTHSRSPSTQSGQLQAQRESQSLLPRPNPLASHPSNPSLPDALRVSGPPQQNSAEYGAQRAMSASVPPLPQTASGTNLSAMARHHSDRIRSTGVGCSARGDWAQWVSPEVAMQDGLWEMNPENKKKDDHQK